ncbi:hypothetical protein K435DRAFT_504515 [Dendrothele bispora CBS 962.96]|uniref:Uncharacterized protein n=1 Tax=Dendrothele bispora (strain CBS 962.96) TaxID=1314807 RepID=A0A4S8KWN7_DENBC|nr:hypothetical protein K435DRAFT_504515 [Dendrothele bispora CBS 962.96]
MSSVPLLLESFNPAPPTRIPTPTFTHDPLPPVVSPSRSSSNSGHSFSTSEPPSRPHPFYYHQYCESREVVTDRLQCSRCTLGGGVPGSTRPDSVMSTVSAKSNGRSYEGIELN